MLNSEWFRKVPCKLELTLRFPYLFFYGFILFITRSLVLWLGFGILIHLVFQNLYLVIILSFVSALFFELFILRKRYLKKVLPLHIKNLKKVKELCQQSEKITLDELISSIIQSVKYSAWSMINFVYGAIPSWGWEIVFRFFYPLMAKPEIPYQDLLIGFGNEVIKADQMLWEISQAKNKFKQQKLFDQFLEKYGSRSDDIDLALPTLREQPKVIRKLISLYKNLPSPSQKLKKAEKKRISAIKTVMSSLRVPSNFFKAFLKITQQNVRLRENRRLYEFQFDFYIRQLILELAKRLNISKNKIFKMSWGEIKNEANKRYSRQ